MATQQITEARAVVLERADSPTGFVLQIITPGIGSSGYYSAPVLEAAVAEGVFPKGTHLYVDHPSQSESADRPERSIRDLAGATKGDAVWNPITQAVEAACKVYPHYSWISEVAEDIGMSIRASADVSEAVIEGRKMPVIEKLVEAFSVDFVTRAGRGGKVLAAIESARNVEEATAEDRRDQLQRAVRSAYGAEGKYAWVRDYDPESSTVYYGMDTPDGGGTFAQPFTVADDDLSVSLTGTSEEVRVVTRYVPVTAGGQATESEETPVPPVPPVQESAEVSEATRLLNEAVARATAAEAERDQLRAEKVESDNRAAALTKATERLGARFDHLPTVKARVIGEAMRSLPMKDGALDVAALEAATDKAAQDEADYLKAALGSGTVSGHGQTHPVSTPDDHVKAEEARGRIPFTRPTVRN